MGTAPRRPGLPPGPKADSGALCNLLLPVDIQLSKIENRLAG
jgi:hypothetical protein